MDGLAVSHPAVRAWFAGRFPEWPTDPQREGWPAIARGGDVLIAAPTGSGKTLAAFLLCIDRLMAAAADGGALPEGTEVVYVSPLRALAADIRQNLEIPLAAIRAVAERLGLPAPALRAEVRTGDTPAASRAAMARRPPHILVTTPESLYLLVTAEKGRAALRGVRTVIVDEIHALARDKRGAHLALTLERLAALAARPPQRIGLSATQRPVETMARLLVGAGPGRSTRDGAPACAIVDIGHRRPLDLAIELPGSELGAVISHEQWAEILDRIAEHVEAHRTTLVFVNTRRLAERLAHLLGERAGHDRVAAHHGSLARDRRLALEARLRAGDLRALVATASLELGIDVGPVELVCQVGSPRSIATFLQRVGRSGHARGATARGRLYPTTRDELVECAALLAAVRAGELDAVIPPAAPLDVLAQQIVAACAASPWAEDELYALVRRAAPYADLPRSDFDAVVEMLADGIATGHGRRGAYLHRDRVNGTVRGRRAARIPALTSGGAIPETADYRVVADPDDTVVGTVNEDWAIESMAGDVFLLGSTSWRIRRVEPGTVRVVDAAGAPPSVPFWLGEAPGRTAELSAAVSALRARAGELIADARVGEAVEHVQAAAGIGAEAAAELVRYLAAGRAALGALPTQRTVVFERFFDETGGMQLVVHAPFGARVNRALGLLLRKRFCRRFDFELQAAAGDDAVLLSLGPRQSVPLDELRHLLSPRALRETLSQAALAAPMWQARWRWNVGRALLVLRRRGGRRNPPPVQRMEADDLMAAVFPALAACQENASGPVEIPDHPMVRQTMQDCLHEAMDLEGLEALLDAIASGAVTVIARDSTEPSALAHEILNGRPYTFLDDAPLEERRSRAVALRRGLPAAALDLGRLDPEAIARVRAEARPEPRDADELHQVLLDLVVARPEPGWAAWLGELARAGRAAALHADAGALWIATESLALAEALFPGAALAPAVRLPAALAAGPRPEPEVAAAAAVRGHLGCIGPCTPAALALRTGLAAGLVETALARLEAEGALLRGRFEGADAGPGAGEVCDRRLLARIHRYTQERLRRGIEPVTAQDLMRFLLRWQHVAPGTQVEGRAGLLAAIEQLEGFEVAAGAWEDAVLAARVAEYRPEWLDDLCLSGAIAWVRLAPRPTDAGPAARPRGAAPASRATPIAILARDNMPWLLAAARGGQAPAPPDGGPGRLVLDCLARHGALFLGDLVAATGRARDEVEAGLWELVARGLVTADGFASVRALLQPRGARRGATEPARAMLRRRASARAGAEGRWALVRASGDGRGEVEPDALAEAVAEQLLSRYGVVFRDLTARETLAVPWRDVLRALRRLEARGTALGGRFVTGFTGEQFALPEAVEALRRTRARERTGEVVRVAAVDPLNLVGILTPGPRVPAAGGALVVYLDGLPVALPRPSEALGGPA
jgi:ATP-dependent Lhr-like helicase